MVPFYENKESNIICHYGSSLNFPPHLHKHIEIVYMLEGRTTILLNGQKFTLKKNNLFISFPNQIHQYISSGPEKYLILIFSPDYLKELAHLFNSRIPKTPIVEDISNFPLIFDFLQLIYQTNQRENLYKETQVKGYLYAFFSSLLDSIDFKKIPTENLSTFQSILYYCTRNYTSQITLDCISDELHVSKYYISHLLKKKTNMGLIEYINALRVSKACELLTANEISITDIAHTVGFNSIRTFNRAFKKEMGISPSLFRKKHPYNL